MKKRDRVFDLIKLYSMLMVITHHFMVEYLEYESIPLKIVNGKYGVQLFAVILGIFAFKSGRKNKEGSLHYALRRYAYFFICELVINSIYFFFNIDGSRLRMSYGYVIGQSVLLGDAIFTTFWFIRDFMAGSVLSFLIGRKDHGAEDILIFVLALAILEEPFVSGCIMGCLAAVLIEKDLPLFKKWPFQIAVSVIALVLMIVLEKSPLTYFIFGICSMLMVIIAKNNKIVAAISDHKVISYLGSLTMPMLLIHPSLIHVVNRINIADNGIMVIILRYLILLVLVLVLSIVLDIIIRFLVRLADKVLDLVFDVVKNRMAKEELKQ